MPETLDHIALLKKLVGFDTTSSKSNRACIDFIRNYLDGFKIKSEIVANTDGGKACIWATLGPAEKGGIVLAGHSDVVPVADQQWTSDPFTLTEREGRLFGRGSCDMKGFIACAIEAAAALAAKNLKSPVHLAFTYNEESDMEGAAKLINHLKTQGAQPEWVWIGEPTGLKIVDAHKGVAAYTTNITGIAGHSSEPDHGLNAIELGARFIDIIGRVAAGKKTKPWPGSRFAPPYTTFNIGTVKGGTAENIIAGHCDILWQARAHPGENLDHVMAEIEALAAQEIAPKLNVFAPRAHMKTCVCFSIPPLVPTKNNPGEATLARLTGHNQPEAVSFATEAGFFQKLGAHAVICGPGHIAQAHQADEYVDKSQLKACAALLDKVLADRLV